MRSVFFLGSSGQQPALLVSVRTPNTKTDLAKDGVYKGAGDLQPFFKSPLVTHVDSPVPHCSVLPTESRYHHLKIDLVLPGFLLRNMAVQQRIEPTQFCADLGGCPVSCTSCWQGLPVP